MWTRQKNIKFAGVFVVLLVGVGTWLGIFQTIHDSIGIATEKIIYPEEAVEEKPKKLFAVSKGWTFDFTRVYTLEPSVESCSKPTPTVIAVVDPTQITQIPENFITNYQPTFWKVSGYYCITGPYLYLPAELTEQQLQMVSSLRAEVISLNNACPPETKLLHYSFIRNGFGAQVNDIAQTMLIGWKKHRATYLSGAWGYSPCNSVDCVFEPVLQCPFPQNASQAPFNAAGQDWEKTILDFDSLEMVKYVDAANGWMPHRVRPLGFPLIYAQFVGLFTQPTPESSQKIRAGWGEIPGFNNVTNCVGLHVRRSDKLAEMQFEALTEEYYIDTAIGVLEQASVQPELILPSLWRYIEAHDVIPLFVSTEDPTVIVNLEEQNI